MCNFMQNKKLKEIVGWYYNSEASYYDTLRNILDEWAMDKSNITVIDDAISTLRNGLEWVKAGGDIHYDGLNFNLRRKK